MAANYSTNDFVAVSCWRSVCEEAATRLAEFHSAASAATVARFGGVLSRAEACFSALAKLLRLREARLRNEFASQDPVADYCPLAPVDPSGFESSALMYLFADLLSEINRRLDSGPVPREVIQDRDLLLPVLKTLSERIFGCTPDWAAPVLRKLEKAVPKA